MKKKIIERNALLQLIAETYLLSSETQVNQLKESLQNKFFVNDITLKNYEFKTHEYAINTAEMILQFIEQNFIVVEYLSPRELDKIKRVRLFSKDHTFIITANAVGQKPGDLVELENVTFLYDTGVTCWRAGMTINRNDYQVCNLLTSVKSLDLKELIPGYGWNFRRNQIVCISNPNKQHQIVLLWVEQFVSKTQELIFRCGIDCITGEIFTCGTRKLEKEDAFMSDFKNIHKNSYVELLKHFNLQRNADGMLYQTMPEPGTSIEIKHSMGPNGITRYAGTVKSTHDNTIIFHSLVEIVSDAEGIRLIPQNSYSYVFNPTTDLWSFAEVSVSTNELVITPFAKQKSTKPYYHNVSYVLLNGFVHRVIQVTDSWLELWDMHPQHTHIYVHSDLLLAPATDKEIQTRWNQIFKELVLANQIGLLYDPNKDSCTLRVVDWIEANIFSEGVYNKYEKSE